MELDKFCQSCMLPKENELFEKSTEKDGTQNLNYCKLWYVNGEFTNPELKTAKNMQEFRKDVLRKQGVGKVKRWSSTMGVPKLDRCNKR